MCFLSWNKYFLDEFLKRMDGDLESIAAELHLMVTPFRILE